MLAEMFKLETIDGNNLFKKKKKKKDGKKKAREKLKITEWFWADNLIFTSYRQIMSTEKTYTT